MTLRHLVTTATFVPPPGRPVRTFSRVRCRHCGWPVYRNAGRHYAGLMQALRHEEPIGACPRCGWSFVPHGL